MNRCEAHTLRPHVPQWSQYLQLIFFWLLSLIQTISLLTGNKRGNNSILIKHQQPVQRQAPPPRLVHPPTSMQEYIQFMANNGQAVPNAHPQYQ